MKQLALAFLNYESVNGHFPTNIYDENGNALLSWRVQLLPYLEGQNIYEQFRLDEPWDSPHNKPLAKQMPAVFSSCDASGRANRGKNRLSRAGG